MWIEDALLGVEMLAHAPSSVDVSGVQYDSRRVRSGDVFVAMRGGSTDGNRFIASAIRCEAAAVVTDSREVWKARGTFSVPMTLVTNGRRALAGIAANILRHPERALKVTAVTGTNGKTTTAFLLEQMLRSVGRRCVLIGTIETHVGDEVRPSEHTTPEASDLLQIFADGIAAGATEAVMEISSHALDQERVWGVPVEVGIFTNLTQDHLDYHGSMEAYAAAKAKMFEGVGTAPPRIAVLNSDDPTGRALEQIARQAGCEVWRYGWETGKADGPEFRARDVKMTVSATTYQWKTPWGEVEVASPLTGRVNVYNLLVASCAALARGLTMEEIAGAARRLRHVPGRFQTVPNDRGIMVVVDYAHTDDALRNLLALARELVGRGRIITLFGCGGDRDRMKRPKMGRAAGEGSDLVVLTSDNPRSEDPEVILQEALVGVQETNTECLVEPDRATAIAAAIRAANAGDIVLLSGKGHEKVQMIQGGAVPFDDFTVASEVLENLQSAKITGCDP